MLNLYGIHIFVPIIAEVVKKLIQSGKSQSEPQREHYQTGGVK